MLFRDFGWCSFHYASFAVESFCNERWALFGAVSDIQMILPVINQSFPSQHSSSQDPKSNMHTFDGNNVQNIYGPFSVILRPHDSISDTYNKTALARHRFTYVRTKYA